MEPLQDLEARLVNEGLGVTWVDDSGLRVESPAGPLLVRSAGAVFILCEASGDTKVTRICDDAAQALTLLRGWR